MTKLSAAILRRLQILSDEGCAISSFPGGPLESTIAVGLVWVVRGNQVYWAALGAEDQHHIHVIDATSGKVHYNRDVTLRDRDGNTWCFGPAGVCMEIEMAEWQPEWDRYQAFKNTPEGAAAIREFLQDAIGSAPAKF